MRNYLLLSLTILVGFAGCSRRDGKGGGSTTSSPPEAKSVASLLERKLPLIEKFGAPADEVFETVAQLVGTEIVVKWDGEESSRGLWAKRPVYIRCRDVSGAELLDFLVDEVADSCDAGRYVDRGVVRVLPDYELKQIRQRRKYDLDQLARRLGMRAPDVAGGIRSFLDARADSRIPIGEHLRRDGFKMLGTVLEVEGSIQTHRYIQTLLEELGSPINGTSGQAPVSPSQRSYEIGIEALAKKCPKISAKGKQFWEIVLMIARSADVNIAVMPEFIGVGYKEGGAGKDLEGLTVEGAINVAGKEFFPRTSTDGSFCEPVGRIIYVGPRPEKLIRVYSVADLLAWPALEGRLETMLVAEGEAVSAAKDKSGQSETRKREVFTRAVELSIRKRLGEQSPTTWGGYQLLGTYMIVFNQWAGHQEVRRLLGQWRASLEKEKTK